MNFWDQSLSHLSLSLICYVETAGFMCVPVLEEKTKLMVSEKVYSVSI